MSANRVFGESTVTCVPRQRIVFVTFSRYRVVRHSCQTWLVYDTRRLNTASHLRPDRRPEWMLLRRASYRRFDPERRCTGIRNGLVLRISRTGTVGPFVLFSLQGWFRSRRFSQTPPNFCRLSSLLSKDRFLLVHCYDSSEYSSRSNRHRTESADRLHHDGCVASILA